MLIRIVSGGQTGVDRAALDAALDLGIPCGGWCPKGRLAEDGPLGRRYPLMQTPSVDFAQRTRWNVRDSDGTLILTWGPPRGGTKLTVESAQSFGRPFLVVNMEAKPVFEDVLSWVEDNRIKTLNVAGPRGSFANYVYDQAHQFLNTLLLHGVKSDD